MAAWDPLPAHTTTLHSLQVCAVSLVGQWIAEAQAKLNGSLRMHMCEWRRAELRRAELRRAALLLAVFCLCCCRCCCNGSRIMPHCTRTEGVRFPSCAQTTVKTASATPCALPPTLTWWVGSLGGRLPDLLAAFYALLYPARGSQEQQGIMCSEPVSVFLLCTPTGGDDLRYPGRRLRRQEERRVQTQLPAAGCHRVAQIGAR